MQDETEARRRSDAEPEPEPEAEGSGSGLDALRDRFWERASLEGLELDAFLADEVAVLQRRDVSAREAGFAHLRDLVEDVTDTRLLNIALKAEDEGTIYAELADERIEEVQGERARLIEWLDRAQARPDPAAGSGRSGPAAAPRT